jgi:hypothetical protein
MGRAHHRVPFEVNSIGLIASVGTPEKEDDAPGKGRHSPHGGVREPLPPLVGVRPGRARTNRQDGIEKKHTLIGPFLETAMTRRTEAHVRLKFTVDVDEGRRKENPRSDREGEAMGVTRPRIRVLTKDHNPHIIQRALEGPKGVLRGRVDDAFFTFPSDERGQLSKIRLPELGGERFLPRRVHLESYTT